MPPDNSGSLNARTVARTATLMLAMLVSTVLLALPHKVDALSVRDATSNSASSGTDVSVARPTGTTAGDVVIVVIHTMALIKQISGCLVEPYPHHFVFGPAGWNVSGDGF